MANLGYVGLGAFALLILGTLWINYQTRKIARAGRAPPNSFVVQLAYGLDAAMVSFLVGGYFVTVLYYPFFWINLAFTVALSAIVRRDVRRRAVNVTGGEPIGAGEGPGVSRAPFLGRLEDVEAAATALVDAPRSINARSDGAAASQRERRRTQGEGGRRGAGGCARAPRESWRRNERSCGGPAAVAFSCRELPQVTSSALACR